MQAKYFIRKDGTAGAMYTIHKDPQWEQDVPSEILPLIEDVLYSKEKLTIEFVIEQCEAYLAKADKGTKGYNEVEEYYTTYRQLVRKPKKKKKGNVVPKWIQEVPSEVMPLLDNGYNTFTLAEVITHCEWILEQSGGDTWYGDEDEDEGVAEVGRYYRKYRRYVRKGSK